MEENNIKNRFAFFRVSVKTILTYVRASALFLSMLAVEMGIKIQSSLFVNNCTS